MARLLVRGEWYDAVSSSALYEEDFEALLAHHGGTLYPDFHLVPFKCTVQTEDGRSARADLALIDRTYRDWWIVEAELAHHSLSGHVLPQIRTLADAVYSSREAAYLARQLTSLDAARLAEMMKGRQPRVLVIVNAARPDWVEPLARHDALLGVCEIFRSRRNEHVLRINGDHPAVREDIVSDCECDPLIPRLLIVHAPSALNVPPRGRVVVHYQDGVTEWERVDAKDRVWLAPTGGNPLVPGKTYELRRRSDGALVLAVTEAVDRRRRQRR
jgi:hypothetical protein